MIKKVIILVLSVRLVGAAEPPLGALHEIMRSPDGASDQSESSQSSTSNLTAASKDVQMLFYLFKDPSEFLIATYLKKVSLGEVLGVRLENGDTIMHVVMRCKSESIRKLFLDLKEFAPLMEVQNNLGATPRDIDDQRLSSTGSLHNTASIADSAGGASARGLHVSDAQCERIARTRNKLGRALFTAILNNDVTMISEVLKECKQNNLNTALIRNSDKDSVLHWAAICDAPDAFSLLLPDHAHLLTEQNARGQTVYYLMNLSSKSGELMKREREYRELQRVGERQMQAEDLHSPSGAALLATSASSHSSSSSAHHATSSFSGNSSVVQGSTSTSSTSTTSTTAIIASTSSSSGGRDFKKYLTKQWNNFLSSWYSKAGGGSPYLFGCVFC